MTDEINFYSRKKEYGWLSNFERAEQMVGYFMFPTNEHYYQSQKARKRTDFLWIKDAPTPYAAMKAGRGLRKDDFKSNWDDIKVGIMLNGLRAKFSQHPNLKAMLLGTGNAILHEDSPTDMFWGKKGRDMLGKLLMKVRDELRND